LPETAITVLTGDDKKPTHVLAYVEPGERMTMMVYDTAPVLHDVEVYRRRLESG